jgi:hypothetical protein
LRLAGCDEKLGHQSKQVYEQIVREFADQPAAVQARKRLALITQQERPAPPATMSERKIEWSRLGFLGPADTDGERAVYSSADKLVLWRPGWPQQAPHPQHQELRLDSLQGFFSGDAGPASDTDAPTHPGNHQDDGTGYRT